MFPPYKYQLCPTPILFTSISFIPSSLAGEFSLKEKALLSESVNIGSAINKFASQPDSFFHFFTPEPILLHNKDFYMFYRLNYNNQFFQH